MQILSPLTRHSTTLPSETPVPIVVMRIAASLLLFSGLHVDDDLARLNNT